MFAQKVQAAKQKRAAAAEAEREQETESAPVAGEKDAVSQDMLASKDEDVIF